MSTKWRFNQNVSTTFDNHVQQNIPCYDSIQRMVLQLSDYFIDDNSVIYDIGSSTGETLIRLNRYHSDKNNLQFVGIDSSESMIEVAKDKTQNTNIIFEHSDVVNTKLKTPINLVTCIFTLQFLTLNNRYNVLKHINQSLIDGGAIILAEKIYSNDPVYQDMWNSLYWDFKQEQQIDANDILTKSKSLRGVLNPLTIKQNVNLLQQCGFQRTETFFQWYNWVGIIGIKNSLV